MKNYISRVMSIALFGMMSIGTIVGHEDPLNPLQEKLYLDFIYRRSCVVAQRIKDGKILSKEFQEFLETDEAMQKMLQIYGDGTGEFSLRVIQKKEDILAEIIKRQSSLHQENTASAKSQVYATLGCWLGGLSTLGGLGIGLSDSKDSGKQTFGGILSAAGIFLGIYSAVRVYHYGQKQEEKQQHITEITKIEEKWLHSFDEAKKNQKHQQPHHHHHHQHSDGQPHYAQ